MPGTAGETPALPIFRQALRLGEGLLQECNIPRYPPRDKAPQLMKPILWLAVLIFPGAGLADDAPPPDGELGSLIERCYGNCREDELTAAKSRKLRGSG